MIITSIIPGRIRIRDRQFYNTAQAERLRSDLLALDGIRDVTLSARTGSLLICCCSAAETMQKIVVFLDNQPGDLEGATQRTTCRCAELWSSNSRLHKNSVNMGMVISLLTSMIGVTLGAETLHIAAGVLFLATLAVHLYERRKAIYISA